MSSLQSAEDPSANDRMNLRYKGIMNGLVRACPAGLSSRTSSLGIHTVRFNHIFQPLVTAATRRRPEQV